MVRSANRGYRSTGNLWTRGNTGSLLTACLFLCRSCPLLTVEQIGQRPLWTQSLELPELAMQPLPAGAFLEEVAEDSTAQAESEPKVLDPEEDLMCIAKTFSYLRESGELPRRQASPGRAAGGYSALTV